MWPKSENSRRLDHQLVKKSISILGISIVLTALLPLSTSLAGTGDWVATATPSVGWFSIASSSDGSHLAAVSGRGQIYTSTDFGTTWALTNGPMIFGASITSSSDGSHLAYAGYRGLIYTSTDFGVKWTPRATPQNWASITSSSDGSHLAAPVAQGLIFISADFGVTWTPRATPQNWTSITSSSDGSHLASVVGSKSGPWITENGVQVSRGDSGGLIYTSTDFGATWTPRATPQNWTSIATSSDGSHLAAVVAPPIFVIQSETLDCHGLLPPPDDSKIYTSADFGVTWTPIENFLDWQSIVSSSDGSHLAAISPGRNKGVQCIIGVSTSIYTSIDFGLTWTQTNNPPQDAVSWSTLASSSDGSHLAASDWLGFGPIYTSLAHSYTVSFIANMPTAPSTIVASNSCTTTTIESGPNLSGSMKDQNENLPSQLLKNSFGIAGYAFSGWKTSSDGTGISYSDGAQYSFTADSKLYAQWTITPDGIAAAKAVAAKIKGVFNVGMSAVGMSLTLGEGKQIKFKIPSQCEGAIISLDLAVKVSGKWTYKNIGTTALGAFGKTTFFHSRVHPPTGSFINIKSGNKVIKVFQIK